MKDTIKKKRFDSNKEGIKIIRVAAFCFAIISWIATAQGLHAYVFQDYYWQAILISFGIQAVLLVFNLKLPYYINKIKKIGLKITIIGLYILTLLASSFFSFVYMSDLVYKETKYIDADIVLDKTYRMYLSDADKYTNELLKVTQLTINNNLSKLQKLMPTDNTDENAKSKVELEEAVTKAQIERDSKKAAEDIAQANYDNAYERYNLPMSEYWRSDGVREKEKKDLDTAAQELEAARKATIQAEGNLKIAEDNLKNYVPSMETTIQKMLVESLNSNLTKDSLNSLLIDLEKGKDKLSSNNFADVVTATQELAIAIDNYNSLCDAQSQEGENNDILDLKNQLTDDNVIPIPSSENFESDKELWINTWNSRFSSLKEIIKSLPSCSDEMIDELNTEIIDVEAINNFNKEKIVNRIGKITRTNLANINVMERAVKLLISEFPFLAWFSLATAIFLDISSLLAGLFIYSTSYDKEFSNSNRN